MMYLQMGNCTNKQLMWFLIEYQRPKHRRRDVENNSSVTRAMQVMASKDTPLTGIEEVRGADSALSRRRVGHSAVMDLLPAIRS